MMIEKKNLVMSCSTHKNCVITQSKQIYLFKNLQKNKTCSNSPVVTHCLEWLPSVYSALPSTYSISPEPSVAKFHQAGVNRPCPETGGPLSQAQIEWTHFETGNMAQWGLGWWEARERVGTVHQLHWARVSARLARVGRRLACLGRSWWRVVCCSSASYGHGRSSERRSEYHSRCSSGQRGDEKRCPGNR